jgi:hypothetical protein
MAVTCGYAVESLGFFQIPLTTTHHHKNDSRTAIIQVTNGVLSIPNVISELERLIPTKWAWKVDDLGGNTFRTVFSQQE